MENTTQKRYALRQQWMVRRFYPTMETVSQYRTIPEAAALLQVPEATIVQWLDDHKLSACKLGADRAPHIDLEQVLTHQLLDAEPTFTT